MPEDQKANVQTVLNELWNERLIPFPLTVGKLTKENDEYTIHFHDSRMSTAHIQVTEGHPFKNLVRSAVLDRVARMSGPLHLKAAGV